MSSSAKNKPTDVPLIERTHPWVKMLISLSIAIIVYFAVPAKRLDALTHLMIGWNTFSTLLILEYWIAFLIINPGQIRQQSRIQDPSRTIAFLVIIISTLASILAVLLLLLTKQKFREAETLHLVIAISGMLLSWFLIHTLFTAKYAHIYYGDSDETPDAHAGGLDFPGDKKPEYLDFAYFSFVLGMTFQVSDVQITSKRIRRLAMWHGLLSFGYNTIMIALTINLIAGFSG
ncbi:MAG TPA: DUF1345 domain-containing protein [Chitinophagaceae bacterium]|nr:DUF1345 domain-containing protein [Chitinophagaceae bacterium]